jgi:hypothetical protein
MQHEVYLFYASLCRNAQNPNPNLHQRPLQNQQQPQGPNYLHKRATCVERKGHTKCALYARWATTRCVNIRVTCLHHPCLHHPNQQLPPHRWLSPSPRPCPHHFWNGNVTRVERRGCTLFVRRARFRSMPLAPTHAVSAQIHLCHPPHPHLLCACRLVGQSWRHARAVVGTWTHCGENADAPPQNVDVVCNGVLVEVLRHATNTIVDMHTRNGPKLH